MLKPIEHVIKNPNDLPDIPRATKEYLQVRFNASYAYQHLIPNLRKQGHSEEFISGVLWGLFTAEQVVDEIDIRKALINQEE